MKFDIVKVEPNSKEMQTVFDNEYTTGAEVRVDGNTKIVTVYPTHMETNNVMTAENKDTVL